MLNPLNDVTQLTLNDPQMAVPLLDFMLWLTTTPNVAGTDEYEEIVDRLYSMVPHYHDAKTLYLKSRLVA